MYRLANEKIALSFDPVHGTLTEFKNLETGYDLIGQPALALGLAVMIPVEGHRNNICRSGNQQLASYQAAQDGNSAVLRYEKMDTPFGGVMDVTVEITVSLHGSQAAFHVTVENHSIYTVEEVYYPCFGGVARFEKDRPLVSRSLQFAGGLSGLALEDQFSNGDYWGTDYPTVLKSYPTPAVSAPCQLIGDGKHGLYLGVHGYEPEYAGFLYEYKPGYSDCKHHRLLRDSEIPGVAAGFCISVSCLPFIAPGETMTLAPVVAEFYEGDWHQALAPYRSWRNTWHRPVKRPSWLEEADCWMTLHINSPEGCCRYRYSELPGIMAKAKEKGVKVLQLIGWARGGQDGDEPYQDTDPLLGTREELKHAIAQIEAMGIHVLLMCKFKWADQSTREYEEELLPLTMKDIFGKPVQFGGYAYQTSLQKINGGSRRSGAGMCHLSKEFRRIALRELDKILELKPSGIMYDELANPFLLCFDPSHGHRPGQSVDVGALQMAKEFYEEGVKIIGDDFFMAGEGPSDVMSQYYLGSYIRSDDGNMGEPVHIPVWKYLNPDWHIATCLVGYDDREMVNQCMTYGYAMNYEPSNFKGEPDDVPLTAKAVMEAQALRMHLKDYIWNGTFLDTEGVTVTAKEPGCEYIYSVFRNKKNGKRAVVAANQCEKRGMEVDVILPSADSFCLYRPGKAETEITDGTAVFLPARSCCVLVEQ